MQKANIKFLIAVNKDAVENIVKLEDTVTNFPIADEKDKANFGNLCIALKGYRMVAEATEAMLNNDNVLVDDNGDYYQKIEDEPIVPPSTENKPGSDFDADKKK